MQNNTKIKKKHFNFCLHSKHPLLFQSLSNSLRMSHAGHNKENLNRFLLPVENWPKENERIYLF